MLTATPNFLKPRDCFLPPPQEITIAVAFLKEAIKAHNDLNEQLANQLIKKADIQALEDWRYLISGKCDQNIHRFREVNDLPPIIEKDKRVKARMPTRVIQKRLIAQYGYNCAYCHIALIDSKTFKKLKTLYPKTARWGSKNTEKHHALKAMYLTFDHVLPHSRGGDNTEQNLVVSCQTCNCGKGNATLQELGLTDPRSRAAKKPDWNGLLNMA